MTMLSGDFPHDSAVTGHCPDTDADPRPADMPDDARLYLRHVEKGESIRSLARELGCHASTILRRIRKFEARRDDPLIDRALDRGQDGSRLDEAQILRALRRLAESGAVLAVAEGMDKAIVTRDGMRTAIIERRLAESMALNGWVAQISSGRIMSYAIVPAGREALRSMLNRAPGRALPRDEDFDSAQPVGDAPDGDQGPHAAQRHRIWEDRVIRDPEDDRRRRARVNIAESPLLVLARRRDAGGQPFLTSGQVAAGERLREDFELAQMGPRVTQNWDGFMTSGIDVSRSAGGYRGGSESARDRVAGALRDLGPGMGDIVLRVCCFLEGIEQTERRLGWSARSGKIVLRLALLRLERHYLETYGKGSPLIG
ncbi:MAG: DUF6456 domain-containing protein [Paracoccus sp. (in: a-proteobacteria)]|uniref:DUF6456 domain-containing protein n=1 Tax=Paracoccus sp. TaxID=267 RepID=UPI0026DFCE6A|nr:DUF6456 domain-containing protein [Paracoccus sp. (in: a-proteobacteria)]MDO5631376.1 DUF6456 domain-containing protein [Paracoccus sp. (in: a-proteobacteria)]